MAISFSLRLLILKKAGLFQDHFGVFAQLSKGIASEVILQR
jgi:hypothetical protein